MTTKQDHTLSNGSFSEKVIQFKNELLKARWWLLAGILIIASALRLWRVATFDIIHDDALYSFRSLGWFDFIGGGQTTPVNWFTNIPNWSHLSFHDGPPLVFWIKHLFFSI